MALSLETLRTQYRSQILEIVERCDVEHVCVFGSVARGEASEDSDIDFLVHPKPTAGFSIGGLYWQLEELLQCKVDVATDTSLHWYIRDKILQEEAR